MDRQEFNGIPYPAMPPEARVALIVAKYAMYGIVPLVIPSVFQDIPIPVERIPSHEGTDLAYVNQLAADVGHTFYIDPGPLPGMNTAYWGPEIKVGIPQPALNTDMDRPHERRVAELQHQPHRQGDAGRVHPERADQGADPDPHPGHQPAPAAARRRAADPDEVSTS